jgi:hypothetical protein
MIYFLLFIIFYLAGVFGTVYLDSRWEIYSEQLDDDAKLFCVAIWPVTAPFALVCKFARDIAAKGRKDRDNK